MIILRLCYEPAEDEALRKQQLERARAVRDLLLSYGAVCDSSLDQRRQFIGSFSRFWSKLSGNVVYAYVEDNGQIVIQATDSVTRIDIPEDLRRLRTPCEEWAAEHQESEDTCVAILPLYNEDARVLYRLEWALEKYSIRYERFASRSKMMRCNIPALINVFETHTLEEIEADRELKLFEAICPDQGEYRMFPPEREAELNAL